MLVSARAVAVTVTEPARAGAVKETGVLGIAAVSILICTGGSEPSLTVTASVVPAGTGSAVSTVTM